MSKLLTMIGAGGHSKVVKNAAKLLGFEEFLLFDDDSKLVNTKLDGVLIQKRSADSVYDNMLITIGNNMSRKTIAEQSFKSNFTRIIHPTATIAEDVQIGEGSVIMAGAVIQSGTVIGKHCIVNSGAIVEHDCIVNDYVHIAPKAGIAGGVMVNEGVFIGLGANIIELLKIGAWSQIGAGATVINDIIPKTLNVGIPAKNIKELS